MGWSQQITTSRSWLTQWDRSIQGSGHNPGMIEGRSIGSAPRCPEAHSAFALGTQEPLSSTGGGLNKVPQTLLDLGSHRGRDAVGNYGSWCLLHLSVRVSVTPASHTWLQSDQEESGAYNCAQCGCSALPVNFYRPRVKLRP